MHFFLGLRLIPIAIRLAVLILFVRVVKIIQVAHLWYGG
ncbi:MAG: hypothetical protein JWM56_821 [Candidatus Peribacteria bacterium]|nr:hypothetical protein [Candidatus Peribacteria bacterium]